MNVAEISKSENELVQNAKLMNEEFFLHAEYAVDFAHSFIKKVDPNSFYFLLFLSSFQKHIILAFLSAVRFHHIQTNFNLRFASEAAAWGSFAIGKNDPEKDKEKFALIDEDGMMNPNDDLKKKMYKWLDEKYPDGSASLKQYKGQTNALSSHANIVDAHRTSSGLVDGKFKTQFFDCSEDRHIKTDLWATANLVMGALDLFYGVNKDFNIFEFQEDFLEKMKILKTENDRLKEVMLSDPHLSKHKPKHDKK
ncbi:MAG: hypothetical protein Q8P30_00985 [Candidatus Uhrbacteria bacterium]|nr:hypothetical protein [Candidatus Uhrbacteria bacterium]